jgi:TatD DNase family protein
LTICTKLGNRSAPLNIARHHDHIWCSVGTHPHNAGDGEEAGFTADDIVDFTTDDAVVAIGETGLDYHYDNAPRKDQWASFEKHLIAAKNAGLPVIIHARQADEDIAQILRDHAGDDLNGVMHCFASGRHLAETALDIGFYISFSGIVTFPNARELQSIAANIPMDRLLVETDAPYLAPQEYRGDRNEPAYVRKIAEKIAELKLKSMEEIEQATTNNFFQLFSTADQDILE